MAPTPTTTSVLSYIRQWINRARADTASDADLLRRFTENGNETAFALLMDRHGPMVLGTARRLVGEEHLAEDVFQATFLTLARQARRLRRAAALPAWLHAVACRLALTALRQSKRRRRAESEALVRPTVCPADAAVSHEQLQVLDEELHRLPERFRLPLVLCCLEGRSQAEAAALLGWTLGSVKGRLERGRLRLRERLRRRGVTVAVAAVIPPLPQPTLAATLRDTVLQAMRSGACFSPMVSALVGEACKPLILANWKAILFVAVLGLVGIGAGMASRFPSQSPASQPSSADDSKLASPHAERNPDVLPPGAVARIGWSPLRIGNAAFALTSDGRTIVTVTPQGLVRRFDAATGQLVERRQLFQRIDVDPVGQPHVHLSADGQVVVISEPYEGKGRLTVWEVSSGKQIFQRASTAKRRTGLGALSPDGKLLALLVNDWGSNKNALQIAHLNSGQIRVIGSLEFNVYDVYFSSDGKRLVLSQISSTNGSSTLACFDVTAGKELWRVPRKGINFAFSPDGSTVLSVMRDQREVQILAIDPASGKPAERYVPCNDVHPNSDIVIAPDNRTVVRNHFGEIILWDLQVGKEIRHFSLPQKNNTSGWGPRLGAFSPDSRTMVTNIGHLQRWDLATGKPFFTAKPDDGLAGAIEYIGFTPDGQELFARSWGLTSGRWNMKTKKRIAFENITAYGHQLVRTSSGLRTLRVDALRNPSEVTLIDPLNGKPQPTVRWTDPKEVTVNGMRAFTLTTDGKTLLTVHGKEPGEKLQTTYVTACDVASGRRLARFAVPGNFYFERSPFSPCGRWVVIGEKVYHVGSGTMLFAPAGEPGERLVATWDRETQGSVWFSEDGRLMASLLRKKGEESSTHDTLGVWELATGALLARYPEAGFIAQAAFSPDGRVLALLDGRGIRLEDLQTGERLAEYTAPDVYCLHTDRGCFTQTLVFSPDGSALATGHQDGTIMLWKVPRSRPGQPAALKDDEAKRLWRALGSSSASTGRAAVGRLVGHPDAAVALLNKHLRPPPADAKLAALINDLDSDVFATREEASRKLRAYGAGAEASLRRTLAQAPSVELRRRIENILAEMPLPLLRLPLSGERLRSVRAVEVLERIGNAATRPLLLSWAEQTADVQLAVEARMALERLLSVNSQSSTLEKRQLP